MKPGLVRSIATLALLAATPLAALALTVPAGERTIPALRGEVATARVFRLDRLTPAPPRFNGPARERIEGEVPMGDEAFEYMRHHTPPVRLEDLTHVTLDRPGPAPLAPNIGDGMEGITQRGYIPGEPTVAVGPSNVFSAGNIDVMVVDKNGANRVVYDGATFFGASPLEGPISDAVCHYDQLRGRFVALCFTEGSSGSTKWSNFYLAISATSDARGTWYQYKFDMTKDGTTQTTNWGDFEGFGLSDDKLALSCQMFSFSGNAYKYQKIRVIDRALAYTGAAVSYVDFANFAVPSGGDVNDNFVTRVGVNQTAGDATIHTLCVRYSGGSRVTYRTITGTPASPTLSAGTLVTVNAYSAPVNAPQLGTAGTVATNDCRSSQFHVRNGVLTTAWHFGASIGGGTVDAVRLFQMRTSDHTVLTDETFGAAGTYYYYPAAMTDSVGSVYLGFGRSNASEEPSSWATGRRRSDATLETSVLLHGGLTATSQSRWGDYTGIDMDESANQPSGTTAWYAGQFTKGTTTWGAWLSPLGFTYGVVAGSVVDDCDGSAVTSGDRTAVAGATVTLKQGATTLGTRLTDANGAYTFGYLETGVYDVVVTVPGGRTATDAVPGSGGNSQTRVSATDLSVDLTNAQGSAGNTFLLGSTHPAPTAGSLSPSSKNAGDPGFTLTVTGSNFVACSVVRIDGNARTTTYVDASHLSASIPASDIAASGTRQISVQSPAPGGGTSGSLPLTVNSVDIQAPLVTLGAPAGGENWKAGASHAITWNATDNIGVTAVDLALSTDGGASFAISIASGLANSGSYAWTVPNTPVATARVRVIARDAAGNAGRDSSHTDFSISTWTITASAGAHGNIAPLGAVAVPEGGTQGFTITPDPTWHVADVLVDGGSIGAVTTHTFTGVTGDHTIAASFAQDVRTLTTTTAGQGALARSPDQPSYPVGTPVTLTPQPAVGWGFSAWSGDTTGNAVPMVITMWNDHLVGATFVDIAPPTVTVTHPVGGESFAPGAPVTLTWSASDNVGIRDVDLVMFANGLAGAADTLAARVANTGSYPWTAYASATSNAFFEVVAHDSAGNATADASDSAFVISLLVGVADERVSDFALLAPRPNPTTGTTQIGFTLPRESTLRMSVLDVQGREVAVLADGPVAAGRHQLTWSAGSRATPPGVYFARLRVAGREFVRRIALVR